MQSKNVDIEKVRNNIKLIDEKIVKLFEKRMKEVEKIANYKKQNKLPILDKKQEKKVIDRNIENLKNKELKTYYKQFIQSILNISKKYQKDINNKVITQKKYKTLKKTIIKFK